MPNIANQSTSFVQLHEANIVLNKPQEIYKNYLKFCKLQKPRIRFDKTQNKNRQIQNPSKLEIRAPTKVFNKCPKT